MPIYPDCILYLLLLTEAQCVLGPAQVLTSSIARCQSCKKFGEDGNIFGLLTTALSTVVINETRATTPRIIIINTGSIRKIP